MSAVQDKEKLKQEKNYEQMKTNNEINELNKMNEMKQLIKEENYKNVFKNMKIFNNININ